MNDVIRELQERKSVRVYEDKPLTEKEKELIIQSALQAPTAGNMTLYSILNITDQELKERLSVTCDNQSFIAKAPFVLVFCADYRRWFDAFLMVEDEVRKPGEGDFLLAVSDTLIAAQNAVTAAWSLGIGSCYIGDILENYEIHRELFHLPKYVAPVCMVCFGYPTKQQKERRKPERILPEYVVYENHYTMISEQEQREMFEKIQGRAGEELDDFLKKFCKRKWNCDFSIEMTRSVKAMIEEWIK